MYHDVQIKTFPARGSGSITLDLYKDFYMIPNGLPVISPPKVKTHFVDIPGANGNIDLTEALLPYPAYENRQGSIEFVLLKDRLEHYNRYRRIHGNKSTLARDASEMWAYIYSDLMNKIHGRRCQIKLLDDDPYWYYEGRVAVNSWKSSNDGKWPTIVIDYDLMPYKLSTATSLDYADEWKWDPFSFMDGVIYNTIETSHTSDGLFSNIQVDAQDYVNFGIYKRGSTNPNEPAKLYRDVIGFMPVCPTIKITAHSTNMGIAICSDRTDDFYAEPELGYLYKKEFPDKSSDTTYTDPECILYDYLNNGLRFMVKGQGTLSISFRKGSL